MRTLTLNHPDNCHNVLAFADINRSANDRTVRQNVAQQEGGEGVSDADDDAAVRHLNIS
jgi:hypothetical protein